MGVDESSPVVAFLKECGLQMYAVQLLHHGFDEMETLVAIEEADMKAIGLPASHATRLHCAVLKYRGETFQEEAEENPVAAFLEEHGLGQYVEAMVGSGFDEMETLMEIEDSDLKDLGVPRGHVRKLRRHLRQHMLSEYQEVEVRPEPLPARPMLSQSQAVGVRPVSAKSKIARPATQHRLEASEKAKGDVERSWEKVCEVGSFTVGELLYRYTFDLAPVSMNLFPASVRNKYREWTPDEEGEEDADLMQSVALRKLFAKVVNAVGCTVAGLRDTGSLVPMLLALGNRHIAYGVPESYWEVLGQALDMTLADILGEDYTMEVKSAWATVYKFMSSIMIQGLREAIKRRDGALQQDVGQSSVSESMFADEPHPEEFLAQDEPREPEAE